MKYIPAFILFLFTVYTSAAQKVIPLYNGTVPGNKPGVADKETSIEDGIQRISNISKPTLTIYLPAKEKANGTAVVVCPGGGYTINAFGHEGIDVAKKLNEKGIAAFVLKYRIPNDSVMVDKTTAPLKDAQRAIKIVRDSAVAWNVNAKRVGIMGFSAGGHLASTAGTHYGQSLIENKENTNLRPDFMILIYPVVSFTDSICHMGSRDNLLGKKPTEALIKLYSNELQVTDDTPPTFLVHASDDGAVKPANSIHFYEALLAHKVPAELHLYQRGGHGFGLNNPTTKDAWMERLSNWLSANSWL